jgi:hypothetical protein
MVRDRGYRYRGSPAAAHMSARFSFGVARPVKPRPDGRLGPGILVFTVKAAPYW